MKAKALSSLLLLVLLTLALALFMLTGCATVPKGSARLQLQSESLSPPTGKASVYVFRPHILFGVAGGGALWEVELDSKLFGYLAPESYLYGAVWPGEHSVGLGYPASTITFNAAEGNNHYFKMFLGFPGVELVEIENDEARKLIGEFTLSGHNIFENTLARDSASGDEQDCRQESRIICLTRTSSWHKEGGKITTKVWAEGREERDDYTFLLNENNELKIITTDWEIIILSGRVMLAKDVPLEKGYEIDWADAPMTNYLLVTGLLNLAFPNGSSDIVSEHKTVISEQKKALRMSTGSAQFEFGAPWQASVRAVRVNDDMISYKIALKVKNTELNIAGVWENMNSRLVLEDSMDISGWETFAIGVFTRQPGRLDPKDPTRAGKHMILDFGAYPHDFGLDTISGLRAYIKQQEDKTAERKIWGRAEQSH
jgi:hypothetical protein